MARGTDPLSFVWGTTADVSSADLPPSVETNNPDGSVTSTLYIVNAGQEYIGEYLCIIMDSIGSRLLSMPANISVLIPDSPDPGLPLCVFVCYRVTNFVYHIVQSLG